MYKLTKTFMPYEKASANFQIEYDTYDQAWDSLIEEAQSNDNYTIFGDSRQEECVFISDINYHYDQETDEPIYEFTDAEFKYGDELAYIGDYKYTIDKLGE